MDNCRCLLLDGRQHCNTLYRLKCFNGWVIYCLQGMERRSEFARAFRDAEINGLHLLELSPTEMAGEVESCCSILYSRENQRRLWLFVHV